MFYVIFTGIRKTNSQGSRSSRVSMESRLFRVPHTHTHRILHWNFPSFLNENFVIPWRYRTGLSDWFTGLFLLAVLCVIQLWITLSCWQIDTSRLKWKSFVCGAIVVSAPAAIGFQKMNGGTHKNSFFGCHHPQW